MQARCMFLLCNLCFNNQRGIVEWLTSCNLFIFSPLKSNYTQFNNLAWRARILPLKTFAKLIFEPTLFTSMSTTYQSSSICLLLAHCYISWCISATSLPSVDYSKLVWFMNPRAYISHPIAWFSTMCTDFHIKLLLIVFVWDFV